MVKRKRAAFPVEEITEDGILISILSLSSLSMRAAVRTSILSRRWRYFWTYIPNLYFDNKNMFEKKRVNISKLSMQEQKSFVEERANKFIRAVNKFLQHHQGFGVQTFYVAFLMDKNHSRHLDQWISFAIASGAKHLTLDLQEDFDFVVNIDMSVHTKLYKFPCRLFADGRGSSLEHICLDSCSLRVPPNFNGFKSLKALHLTEVDVDDSDIENLLSSSPCLESLSVIGNSKLFNLKISQSSGQLKHLILQSCGYLKKIEFSTVKLTLFKYNGRIVSLRYRNAARLTRVFIGSLGVRAIDYFVTRLPRYLPHLNTLFFSVGSNCEVKYLSGNTFKKFTHLKHLVLSVSGLSPNDLLWVSSLLNAAPFLEKFELNLKLCYKEPPQKERPQKKRPEEKRSLVKLCIREPLRGECTQEERSLIRRPSKFPHHHLKKIAICGFNGSISQIEIAIYMLNNAISLELMTIQACLCKKNSSTQEKLHSIASEYLDMEVPECAKLVIL